MTSKTIFSFITKVLLLLKPDILTTFSNNNLGLNMESFCAPIKLENGSQLGF